MDPAIGASQKHGRAFVIFVRPIVLDMPAIPKGATV
jgi:hypothetical protein